MFLRAEVGASCSRTGQHRAERPALPRRGIDGVSLLVNTDGAAEADFALDVLMTNAADLRLKSIQMHAEELRNLDTGRR